MGFDPAAFTEDSRRNWQAAAEGYERMSSQLFGPLTREFLAFAGLHAGERVLDVACGPGTATLPAARAVGPSGRVVGVDLAYEMLKRAGERAAAEGLLQAEFREMNAEALDFPDETFDAAICQLGLMLFARPQAAAAELARVVKKGGRVAVLVQGLGERMQFTSLVMRAMVARAPQLKTPGAPTLYAFGPEGALTALLSDAGFQSPVEKRLAGAFEFASASDYWETMIRSAGKTGAMLKTLDEAAREAVRADVVAAAERLRVPKGTVLIPYEVVMARAERR